MNRSWPILTAALMTWAAVPSAVADQTRVELTDPSAPVELRVEIQWGSIRITGVSEADAVTIQAVADRPGELAGGLVTIEEDANRVTVRQAPRRPGAFQAANLEIETPLRTSLNLQTNRGGDIRVEGVRGLVEVTNLNGSVELRDVSGAAVVNASNGSISAGFATVDPDRDMLFASLNGSVELCLPRSFSARVHLSTAGDPIRSDFEIDREQLVRKVSPGETVSLDQSEVRGRIGPGESRLRVSTLNGEVVLRRCE